MLIYKPISLSKYLNFFIFGCKNCKISEKLPHFIFGTLSICDVPKSQKMLFKNPAFQHRVVD